MGLFLKEKGDEKDGTGMNRQKLKDIKERAANSDFIHLTGTLHITNDLQNSKKKYLTLKYVKCYSRCVVVYVLSFLRTCYI